MTEDSQDFAASYRRFEEKYRGSQEVISKRLETYTPLLEESEKHHRTSLRALDLGMGRGEWLRLLKARGWKVSGVDQNLKMLNTSGLENDHITVGDALDTLRGHPAESYELITAFHVVEHLTHSYLRELISEAHRVLAPGGLVLFETPNLENIGVASWAFFMDPTHVRAIPPLLLSFLLEDSGFHQPFIFRLNGSLPASPSGHLEEILGTLFLSGPDYAVIAEKLPIGQASAAWRTRLSEITQPRPSDTHRLLTLARAMDHVVKESPKNIEQGITEQIERLRNLGERAFDQNARSLKALEIEMRKDREITDLKMRELAGLVSQKFSEINNEIDRQFKLRIRWEQDIHSKLDAMQEPARNSTRGHEIWNAISDRLNRRWKRSKNSVLKRLPPYARERASRRWSKLKKSIKKRLPERQSTPLSSRVPHATKTSTHRSREQTISMLKELISRSTTRD